MNQDKPPIWHGEAVYNLGPQGSIEKSPKRKASRIQEIIKTHILDLSHLWQEKEAKGLPRRESPGQISEMRGQEGRMKKKPKKNLTGGG